jgi:predicted nucleotidyltransferase
MKDTLKIDWTNSKFDRFRRIIKPVSNLLKENEVDFYVLGALARDMIFSQDDINSRATADVDLAIFINQNDSEIFRRIKDELINKYRYSVSSGNTLCLISPEGINVDLLPFGEIEVEDGVTFEGEGLTSIKVNGFKEVYNNSLLSGSTEDGDIFKLASLSAIVLLKLISYDDRPEMRENDPGDVASILAKYFDLYSEKIYDHHYDLFEGEEVRLEEISSRVIGREMREIVEQNQKLRSRITQILDDHIVQEEESQFILNMIGDYCENIETAGRWLKNILFEIEK